MIGEITKDSVISDYKPSDKVRELTSIVRRDFSYGLDVLNKSWPELNNYSVLERTNKDQRTFQSFVDESVEDPNESWKWIGTRSLARKKAFAMHAHMTSAYILPSVFPQNSSQPDDRTMASAMRDTLEWQAINSNYQEAFLLSTMGMLVNPATYLEINYNEVYQKIREKTEGGYQVKEILDEIFSGLDCRILSVDQILITNAHEQNIQKQRSILKRRYVDKTELQAKYGEHENWAYLKSGIKVLYNEIDGLFYEIKDDDHPNLVEEVIWEHHIDDTEVCYLNGIYFGNEDIENNPISHRDNRNAPKYNVVPFGYHRINEHFFYFASLMFEVGWDDRLIDAMYQLTMNREILDAEQPVAYIGFDKVDSSVVFPGSSISTINKDAKVQPILPPRGGNPYRALQEIEDSMSEASLPESEMGVLPEASQKATAIVKASNTAKILLTGAMKNLGQSIKQVGYLLVDVALQHLTAPEIDEITGNLKYKEFILQNQMVGGKKVSKKIRFDESLMGRKMSKTERKQYEMKLLEEVGYPDNKESIIVLNPHLFSKMKYLISIEPDEMIPRNKDFNRQIMERLYTLLRQDPNVDAVSLVNRLLYATVPQDAEELMAKNNNQMNSVIQQIMGKGQENNPPVLPNPTMAAV